MAENEEKGGGVPSGVQSKVGPLPLWAWVVVGAGLLGVLIIIRRQASSPSPDVTGSAGSTGTAAMDSNQSGLATDPMSHSDLLAALRGLSNTQQGQHYNPSVPDVFKGMSGAQLLNLVNSYSWAQLRANYSADEFAWLWNWYHPGISLAGSGVSGQPSGGAQAPTSGTPSSGPYSPSTPGVPNLQTIVATSRTMGGTSTALTTVAGIPSSGAAARLGLTT